MRWCSSTPSRWLARHVSQQRRVSSARAHLDFEMPTTGRPPTASMISPGRTPCLSATDPPMISSTYGQTRTWRGIYATRVEREVELRATITLLPRAKYQALQFSSTKAFEGATTIADNATSRKEEPEYFHTIRMYLSKNGACSAPLTPYSLPKESQTSM